MWCATSHIRNLLNFDPVPPSAYSAMPAETYQEDIGGVRPKHMTGGGSQR